MYTLSYKNVFLKSGKAQFHTKKHENDTTVSQSMCVCVKGRAKGGVEGITYQHIILAIKSKWTGKLI